MNTHLQTKKHKDAYAKYLKTVQLDEDTEQQIEEESKQETTQSKQKDEGLEGEINDDGELSEVEEYVSANKKKKQK